jgi:hypothetical protein
MNWIKSNKFLTGFFAVMLVGIGVLGYFLFSASSEFDTTADTYRGKADELNRLRHLPLYPNARNLKALEAQKSDAAKLVAKFQEQLATREFPADEITPQQFQDRLKEQVTDTVKRAGEAHMELPKDKFYLGFDPYESRPPEPEAVGPLTRQLKAIQWVMDKFIEAKITQLTSLKRIPLPEEKSLASAANNNRKQDRQERAGRELVSMFPVDVELVGRQRSIADALNAIVGASAPQFYIPRVVRIKNQKAKGPDRMPAGAPAGVPGQPAVPLGYIVGDEQLEASMRLEVVEFAPPQESAASKTKISR